MKQVRIFRWPLTASATSQVLSREGVNMGRCEWEGVQQGLHGKVCMGSRTERTGDLLLEVEGCNGEWKALLKIPSQSKSQE